MRAIAKSAINACCSALILGNLIWGQPAAADVQSGAFLAGRAASVTNDFSASFSYNKRVVQLDPDNLVSQENLLLAYIGLGRVADAIELADQFTGEQRDWQVTKIIHTADLLSQGSYAALIELFDTDFAANPLVDQMVLAWAQAGMGNTADALATLETLGQEPGLRDFAIFQSAMVLYAQNDPRAVDIMAGFKTDFGGFGPRPQLMWALMLADRGDFDQAIDVFDQYFPSLLDPELIEIRKSLVAQTVPVGYLPQNFTQATAEIYHAIATFISAADIDPNFILIYVRLAQFLAPDHMPARLIAAQTLQELGQYDLSIDEFAQIAPDHPQYHNAELGRADALDAAGQDQAALQVLENLMRRFPDSPLAFVGYADLSRRSENYDKAITAYSKAIDLFTAQNRSRWGLHYARAISYERTDQWPAAERDFRRALELNPNQPQVLNYLGYSLIEQRTNLDEALDMIDRAIQQSPDSGYIVDSMGWGLYRLGRFQEALPYMERASELMPVDPIVNDHLGDVYWAVGRKLEAEFQWRRALSFDPEEKELQRIRKKLAIGLDQVLIEEGQDPIHQMADN